METRKETHFVVHKLIDGQWKLTTYFDFRPDLIRRYKDDPENFLVSEVEINVPIVQKDWSVNLTGKKWEEICKYSVQAARPEDKELFHEVASVILFNLQTLVKA